MKCNISRRAFGLVLGLTLATRSILSVLPAQAQSPSQSTTANSAQLVGLHAISVRDARSPDGKPAFLLTFDADSAARIREFSANVVGKAIGIYLDGHKLAAPVMRAPMTGDGIQLSGLDEAIANKLRTAAPLILDFRVE